MPENDDLTELTLINLGNGGAVELFDEELQKVLENILDPSTEPKDKRRITLSITLSPSVDRDSAEIEIKAVSKLAPIMSVRATTFIGRRKGRAIAIAHDPRQLQLQWDQESELRSVDDTRQAAGGE